MRFELKYAVNDSQMHGIRSCLEGRLVPDEHNNSNDQIGYDVCSLYLDSPRFMLYHQSIQNPEKHFKLRIRFYDNDSNEPAFLEIKRHDRELNKKIRAAVTRTAAFQILTGDAPNGSPLLDSNMDAVGRFCRLVRTIGARGAAYVVYKREAYRSPSDDYIRVSFDHEPYGGNYNTGDKLRIPDQRLSGVPDGRRSVLEMKFIGRFPNWMREMTQQFKLQHISAPKYAMCVDALGLCSRDEE